MGLRNIERKPVQALLSVIGIAMATSILVLGYFSEDAVSYLVEFQFELSQRQNVTVTFNKPRAPGVIHDLKHLPGVLDCEPFRAVAVRLVAGPRSQRLGSMGLPA